MNDSKAQTIEAIQILMECQRKAGDDKARVRFMPVIHAVEEDDFCSALERWKTIPGRLVIAPNPSDDAELRAAHSIAADQLYGLVNENQFGAKPSPIDDIPSAVRELAKLNASRQEHIRLSSTQSSNSRIIMGRLFVSALGLFEVLVGIAFLRASHEPWLLRVVGGGVFIAAGGYLLVLGLFAKNSSIRRIARKIPFLR